LSSDLSTAPRDGIEAVKMSVDEMKSKLPSESSGTLGSMVVSKREGREGARSFSCTAKVVSCAVGEGTESCLLPQGSV